jgi:hypothetical protein
MVIAEDPDGHIDVADLERQLIRFAGRALRIGSFSAASNVTGILTDTDAVSRLLHAHGALSFWDYAAAGPCHDPPPSEQSAGSLSSRTAIYPPGYRYEKLSLGFRRQPGSCSGSAG